MSKHPCGTVKDKSWPYEQYYIGERDDKQRRNGNGENHWTGAKSLEKYSGRFLRDTMHGVGEYYWRYVDNDGTFKTYEGHFYCNQLHGYGSMSYQDGRVFNGLFYSNIRWGPGIETGIDGRQNVGLWLGNQLVRLAWIPPTYDLIFDLTTTNTGKTCVNAQRSLMTTSTKTAIGNAAAELLMHCGMDATAAENKWMKLYPKHCTDVTSPVFQLQMFEDTYYGPEKQNVLIEKEKITDSSESISEGKTYFAWSNNEIIKHMMKHSFMHDHQRLHTGIKMSHILSESRNNLKAPAKQELDCRILLMASYLGHTEIVVRLINEENIHPDVADMQGNSVLMYAVCGDHKEIIHFLVEAGADVNNYNDSCSTALGIALVRYICAYKEISINDMAQALIPETNTPPSPTLENVNEWYLGKDIPSPHNPISLTKSPSKILKAQRNAKSLMSLKDQSLKKNVPDKVQDVKTEDTKETEDNTNSENLFSSILNEYTTAINELYLATTTGNAIEYLFLVTDITIQLIESEIEEQKKSLDKNTKKVVNNVSKITAKSLNEVSQHNNKQDFSDLLNFTDRSDPENCQQILSTIIQLLSDEADPGLVRCPQPALFMAVSSGSCDLVKQLIDHGANANEFYPHVLGYSPLDIVISYKLSIENLNVVRVLLENGADTRHRLPYAPPNSTEMLIPGPTLLHAVLAKTVDSAIEKEICRELLELLLTYKCSPVKQFNGHSAIDVAMTKGTDIFDVFISHPNVDLNAIINQSKQSILMKMFTLPFFKTFGNKERLEILTNLIWRGANPFNTCQTEEEIFDNIFVFAKKFLDGVDTTELKQNVSASKHENKAKKNGKINDDKSSKPKTVTSDIEEYKQALQLVTDLARLSRIRWLREKLVKKITNTVIKYKHRHWNMVLKEVKDKKIISLWLTPQDCLDIWTNANMTKQKIFTDRIVLKYLLCIVFYCCQYINEKNMVLTKVSAEEKSFIEKEVNNFLRKRDILKHLSRDINYYTPLKLDEIDITQLCFECALPLKPQNILCSLCQVVSFCTYDCLKLNIDRPDCHPCSEELRKMYFPNSDIDTSLDLT